MQLEDVLKMTFLVEMDSVQTSITHYYEVIDNNITSTFELFVKNLHENWWQQWVLFISDQAASTCVRFENLMGGDPVFELQNNLPGANTSVNLPAQDVLKLTLHAVDSNFEDRTATYSYSGMGNDTQRDGKWNLAIAAAVEGYFNKNWVSSEGPVLRPGLWATLNGPAKEFMPCLGVHINRSVKVMPGRITGLCGAA